MKPAENVSTLSISAAPTLLALCLTMTPGALSAQHQRASAHEHFCDPETATATPVLGKADFDGDGTVTEADLSLLRDQVGADDYIAFFDLDADGDLDDGDLSMAQSQSGEQSSELDRQLAYAYQGTRAYRDREVAISDRFLPVTQFAHGHGAHWLKHPETGGMSYSFVPGKPAGLNYDDEGRLWAVFYYAGQTPRAPDGSLYAPGDGFRPLADAPEGFVGDQDVWHFHSGACIEGLAYSDPVMEPEGLNFREGVSPRECLPATGDGQLDTSSTKWNAKFHMLHAWIYEQNPCGTFAGAHPELMPDAMDPATALNEGEKIDPREPHPDFAFEGGTLCAWLAETGDAPEFCQRGG